MKFQTYSTLRDCYIDEHWDFVERTPGFTCLKGRHATICPPGTVVRYALSPKYSWGIIISRTEDTIVVMWSVKP